MATTIGNLINIISPKRKTKTGGQAATPTFNSQAPDRVLSYPQYQEHLVDIFDTRLSDNSQDLLKFLFQHDPDVSAAVFSYLTMANTDMTILARTVEGEIDREATRTLLSAISVMTRPTDYTLGYQMKPNLSAICEEIRYMALLRSAVGAELVFDKSMQPTQIRLVDMASIRWFEKQPGQYKPRQEVQGSQDGIDLDIPTFFTSYFRRDPTSVYTKSIFVSAINTIASRQNVINDLYRIMKRTGYPRMGVSVMESVLRKNMPQAILGNTVEEQRWLNARMQEVSGTLNALRPDDVFVHTDSIVPSIINEKQPAVGIDISKVIDTLNSQNQAGLKTMATVIGRGTSGVNTGSVEARIAALNADELNQPVAEILSDIFSFILHYSGFQGFAEVSFAPAELRPEMELEAQKTMRQARLRKDLSDGLITDDEYHLTMYGRIRPDSAPELSGTKFLSGPDTVDATGVTPNTDPLGRSMTSKQDDMAEADGVKETNDA